MLSRTQIRATVGALPLVTGAVMLGAINRPVIIDEAVAGVVSAVPNVPATLVAAVRTTYPGFDTNIYPGDRAMLAWRHGDSPYEWVGYYLPAPCHKDDSWSGKRATLDDMGWGMAVIYVGQQTWDRIPSRYETRYTTSTRKAFETRRVKQTVRVNGKRVTRTVSKRVPTTRVIRTPHRVLVDPETRPLDECSANLVTGTRGQMEAADAIRRTKAEGFPRGSVVFLDLERMEFMPQAMRDYYREWVRHLLADGTYRPGIYVHTHNAERVYKDVKAEFVAAGAINEPPFWIANSRGFSHDKEPHQVGHSFAAVWQGKLDTYESRNGVRLPIDVNVASVKSPSTTDIVAD